MSICIDKAHNVIVNAKGIAHRTGYVVVYGDWLENAGKSEAIGVAKGTGAYALNRGGYITDWNGPIHPIKQGNFTLSEFMTATGWAIP